MCVCIDIYMYVYIYIYIILVLFGNAFPALRRDCGGTWPGLCCLQEAEEKLPKTIQSTAQGSAEGISRLLYPNTSPRSMGRSRKSWACRVHRAAVSTVLGMTPRGWTGQIFGVDFQKMGLSWHRRKILGVRCGKVFGKWLLNWPQHQSLLSPV